jgi:hypothetical protein
LKKGRHPAADGLKEIRTRGQFLVQSLRCGLGEFRRLPIDRHDDLIRALRKSPVLNHVLPPGQLIGNKVSSFRVDLEMGCRVMGRRAIVTTIEMASTVHL